MRQWLLKFLGSIISGSFIFLACTDFDIWPLAWVAMVPLLFVIRPVSPRRAFFWGWLAGTVTNIGGFYWITNLLQRFGHLPWFISFLLFLGLAAYQGLHFGIFTYLIRKIHNRLSFLPMTMLAPVIMTALELLMPFIFPWYIAITQAWILPVIQIADVTGPLGVTFVLMLCSGLIYDILLSRIEKKPWPFREMIVGSCIILVVLGYGVFRLIQVGNAWKQAPKINVGLVQANIGIIDKGRAALAAKHLELHQEESRKLVSHGAELLVWPESSYPYAFERSMDRDWPDHSPYRVMRNLGVPLLFGVLTFDPQEKYPYNSAYLMEPDGKITGRFDKNYLLIFGEYTPLYEYIPSFRKWFPAASHFSRGTEVTTFPFREHKIGPLICYEDIIPAFTRRLAKLTPNLLINITNDAWFGATSEPSQHLALSVFRAVELRLGLVRAVNTGISAYIDATGKIYNKSQSFDPVVTPGVPPISLLDKVAMLEGGNTIYAMWGDFFGVLNLVLVLAFGFLPTRFFRKDKLPSRKQKKK